jgi:D-tyrosyl-tRNA(Tyr) deacylase
MKAIIQRVNHASVKVENEIVGIIKEGLLVLIGFELSDDTADIQWVINKIVNMRLFDDQNQKMNLSLKDVDGELLLVSQFTLHASTKKGNRPSFVKSAPADYAVTLYNQTIGFAKRMIHEKKIQTGTFGAMMDVDLCNKGPVTITLDSKNKE